MEISWLTLGQLLLAGIWGLGSLVAPAGAQNVHCYGVFDTTTGACGDLLGDEVTQADCCLNQRYGFRLNRDDPCQACRPAEWSEWSPWSACSVSCTEGVQLRSQTCYGQGVCEGGPRRWEMQACNMKDCCPGRKSCEIGQSLFICFAQCNSPPSSRDPPGNRCPGDSQDYQDCEGLPYCPLMGGWSEWGAWTPCSVTCLNGIQTRERSCTNPVPQCGGDCAGNTIETRSCDTHQICPTHGNWGSWGNWENCPATCTPENSAVKPRQRRLRQCNSPPPSRDPPGNRCPGDSQDYQDCEGLPYCPLDGNWGAWMPSGECSVTCGIGRVLEKRLCNNPAPKHGGRDCPGDDTRVFTCNTKTPCPVDGRLTEWTAWTTCGLPVQGIKINCDDIHGLQKRTRECLGRAHNGKFCPGMRIETRGCYNIDRCRMSGAWTEWSPWSLCDPPCGPNPMKSRVRECKPIYPNYPLVVETASKKSLNVSFWGTPLLSCQPLNGQRLRMEEKVPCQNVIRCED